jgi:hypothetical protein
MNLVRLLTAFSVIIGVFVFSHSPAFAQLFAILNGGRRRRQRPGGGAPYAAANR